MSCAERRALVERADPALPLTQQCRLLAVSRASVYRRPAEVSDADRAIMALIDRQYLARPYYGSRRMAAWLATQGQRVNRKRVRRLIRLLGLVAIYPEQEQTGGSTQDLSVPARRARDRAGQSGLVRRRHLYPDGQGLSLPGGRYGLGEPCGAGLATVSPPQAGQVQAPLCSGSCAISSRGRWSGSGLRFGRSPWGTQAGRQLCRLQLSGRRRQFALADRAKARSASGSEGRSAEASDIARLY
jgi:putative transposase